MGHLTLRHAFLSECIFVGPMRRLMLASARNCMRQPRYLFLDRTDIAEGPSRDGYGATEDGSRNSSTIAAKGATATLQ